MEVVLQTRELTKRYGITKSRMVTALKDITVTLERGRIYGLVGNNGLRKNDVYAPCNRVNKTNIRNDFLVRIGFPQGANECAQAPWRVSG